MLALVMTVLILIVVYAIQEWNPFLAGFLAVAPVKVMATLLITFEEGGIERTREAIGGMVVGQAAWAVGLILLWIALR